MRFGLRIACAILVTVVSLQWQDQGFASGRELDGAVGANEESYAILSGIPRLKLKRGSHESSKGSGNAVQGGIEAFGAPSRVYEAVLKKTNVAQEEAKAAVSIGRTEAADSEKRDAEKGENAADTADTVLATAETNGDTAILARHTAVRAWLKKWKRRWLLQDSIVDDSIIGRVGTIEKEIQDNLAEQGNVTELIQRVSAIRSQLTQILTSSSSSAADAQTAEGGKGEGVQAGQEEITMAGAVTFESTQKSPAVDTTNRPIRLDWVKPVTQKEKDEEDKAKVAAGVCDKTQNYGKLYGMGPIAWEPQPGKYVLMDCYRNQMSNRVRCMNKYLIAAGYLNRTLVVPLHADEISRNYDRRAYFDIDHTRRCFGPRTVISRDELLELERERRMGGGGGVGGGGGGGAGNDTVNLDQIVCLYGRCYDQDPIGIPKKMPNYTSIGFSPNLTWTSGGFLSSHSVNITDFQLVDSKLLPSARLITFDDLGSAILDASMQANGSRMNNLDLPFIRSPGCPNPLAIQPHPAILEAADAFVRTKLLQGLPREWEVKNSSSGDSSSSSSSSGGDGEGGSGRLAFGRYMAVHWRRTDLIKSYSHLTVEQTGSCVARKMIRSGNLTTLFLATDTNDEEVKQLEQVIRASIPNLRLVRQPASLAGEDWAAVLAQAHFTHMTTVQAVLDKAICVMADVFLGTDASSFSADINRIRAGLRFQECDDAPICHGLPVVGGR